MARHSIVSPGMESPLDPLFYTDGGDATDSAWERVRAASAEKPRRLGRANALVARSLLLTTMIEREAAAAAELQATGWVAWVDRCLPGEGSLLRPPRLPFGGAEALPPLRGWLKALSEGSRSAPPPLLRLPRPIRRVCGGGGRRGL